MKYCSFLLLIIAYIDIKLYLISSLHKKKNNIKYIESK